jgi:hypothetical protein
MDRARFLKTLCQTCEKTDTKSNQLQPKQATNLFARYHGPLTMPRLRTKNHLDCPRPVNRQSLLKPGEAN